MNEYHKIQTMFKRDMQNNGKKLLEGQWTLPEFEYLANNVWVFTEKVDGTNIRIMFKDGAITFGGKTDNASIPALLFTRLNERFLPLTNKMSEVFDGDVCLYGEGYGAKIQKGGDNYLPYQDFVLFDIKIGPWWLQRKDIEEIALEFDLPVVPVIGKGTLQDAIATVRKGFASVWGDFLAEGIVAKPEIELNTRSGQRIITKIKTRDFNENQSR